MQELIEAIRVAVANDASAEQKATGVQACRTIMAALGSEPGKPIMLPGTPLPAATSRVSVDQMLDLMIARLTTIAAERDAQPMRPRPSLRAGCAFRSRRLRCRAVRPSRHTKIARKP
jgi:hypothetical protein